jgi:hypothetical protein
MTNQRRNRQILASQDLTLFSNEYKLTEKGIRKVFTENIATPDGWQFPRPAAWQQDKTRLQIISKFFFLEEYAYNYNTFTKCCFYLSCLRFSLLHINSRNVAIFGPF